MSKRVNNKRSIRPQGSYMHPTKVRRASKGEKYWPKLFKLAIAKNPVMGKSEQNQMLEVLTARKGKPGDKLKRAFIERRSGVPNA